MKIWPRPLQGAVSNADARYDCLVWLPDDFALGEFCAEDGLLGSIEPFLLQPVPGEALREIEESFGELLRFNPLLDPESLPGCQRGLVVAGSLPDPGDLAHLQTASAICRGLSRMGAAAFFDLLSQRFWDWDETLALEPEREFVIREHITVQQSEGVCSTRGMLKFARPELWLRGEASALLNELALRLALGADFDEESRVELEHPSGQLPPIGFRAYPDDTLDMNPVHGLGQNFFANRSLEVADWGQSSVHHLLTKLGGR